MATSASIIPQDVWDHFHQSLEQINIPPSPKIDVFLEEEVTSCYGHLSREQISQALHKLDIIASISIKVGSRIALECPEIPGPSSRQISEKSYENVSRLLRSCSLSPAKSKDKAPFLVPGAAKANDSMREHLSEREEREKLQKKRADKLRMEKQQKLETLLSSIEEQRAAISSIQNEILQYNQNYRTESSRKRHRDLWQRLTYQKQQATAALALLEKEHSLLSIPESL
jgi:citrate lyase gamma subunit